jgi:hypothetical protein
MIKGIEKNKLPRYMAYIIKSSRIEEWTASENIATDIFLSYGGLAGDCIFSASFCLPSSGIPYEHLLITIGAVKKESASAIRERVKTEIIPALTQWIKPIERLDKSFAAYQDRHFYAQWKGGSIAIIEG